MLQNPSKCHQNPLSHFFALHSSQSINHQSMSVKNEMEHETNHRTHLDSFNGNIGKSFTIAAILGLKKNAAAAMEHHHHHHHNNKDFAVMNLSLNNHSIMKSSLNSRNYDGDSNMLNAGRIPIGMPQNFGSHVHSSHQQHSNANVIHNLQQQLHQQHSGQSSFHGREKSKGGGKLPILFVSEFIDVFHVNTTTFSASIFYSKFSFSFFRPFIVEKKFTEK